MLDDVFVAAVRRHKATELTPAGEPYTLEEAWAEGLSEVIIDDNVVRQVSLAMDSDPEFSLISRFGLDEDVEDSIPFMMRRTLINHSGPFIERLKTMVPSWERTNQRRLRLSNMNHAMNLS